MGHHSKKPKVVKQSTKDKLRSIKKERKLKLKEKRARLIIRNLPFQATDENLKAHFEKFGEIDEIRLVKRDDGSLVGCAFVQFKLVQKAAKARHHLNGKDFMGRALSVDFSKPKDQYEHNKEIKEEPKDETAVEIKEEPIDVDVLEDVVVDLKDEENVKEKKESDEEPDLNEEEDDSDSNIDDIGDIEEKPDVQEEEKPKYHSHDVVEGRTVFVKNIPFSATKEDLRNCMQQFGPLFYAVICVDKLTEHSKGSGFVKFMNVEDAEKALSAGTELTLLGNILDCHKALEREDINKQAVQKKESRSQPKDSRNLYLVKEGVVLAGTKSAEGVSASDMAKRLQIEQYKTQMLRNLNMFVSRDRLVIHNLPASWDDRKLRILLEKYSPKGAVIKEAKVMRDLKQIDSEGNGKSKEFGFVGFTRHEDALAALRALNNNPTIFSAKKRPIITFSIENKTAVKTKQKRLEKSLKKNPKSRQFDAKFKRDDDEKKKRRELKEQAKLEPSENSGKTFVGVTANPGKQKMRTKYNLQTQALLHRENLKKEKKKEKRAKQKNLESIKQDKQKVVNKSDHDNFSKLVADYKRKLTSVPELRKSKWYEGASI